MLILILTAWLLTLLYALLMVLYRRGWSLSPETFVSDGFVPKTKIAVVVPARNEEARIGACIRSILSNNYPEGLLEIVVIDDHSEDRTAGIVAAFREPHVRCLLLKDHLKPGEQLNSYKKKALEIGIAGTDAELIVTTDADCIVPKDWLRSLAASYEQEGAVMVLGPVVFTSDGTLVQRFQSIDFTTMQGITAAAHRLRLGSMGNGANLAFSRAAFEAVGGYRGIDHLASGDDFLLLHKMAGHFPGRIHYLKAAGAIVQTEPQPDWQSFFRQRIRWASKSGKYSDHRLTAILLLVYLFNLLLFILLAGGFVLPQLWGLAGGILLVKIAMELYFLMPVVSFYGKTRELLLFPLLQPVHILYVVSAGLLGFFGSYEWKGRRVR